MTLPGTGEIKTQMIRGAVRRLDESYPNREWGFGRLNVYDALQQ